MTALILVIIYLFPTVEIFRPSLGVEEFHLLTEDWIQKYSFLIEETRTEGKQSVNPCDEFVVKTLGYLGNDLQGRELEIFAPMETPLT
jgi:hypothetical protein